MKHETISGRIVYTSKKPNMLDKVRGGETFIITKYVDGGRTLRTHCAIDEDSPRVLRDTTFSFDPQWRPTDGFVRLTVDEAFVGSSWYRFTPRAIECEGYCVQEGRFSSRLDLDKPAPLIVTHPIQADAFLTSIYDLAKGPGELTTDPIPTVSFSHRGATGPTLLTRTRPGFFRFLGPETITVTAGTFDALRFQIGASTDDADMRTDVHPPYTLWVTADGDYVLLKAQVTGYMQTYYELAEYDRRTGF